MKEDLQWRLPAQNRPHNSQFGIVNENAAVQARHKLSKKPSTSKKEPTRLDEGMMMATSVYEHKNALLHIKHQELGVLQTGDGDTEAGAEDSGSDSTDGLDDLINKTPAEFEAHVEMIPMEFPMEPY